MLSLLRSTKIKFKYLLGLILLVFAIFSYYQYIQLSCYPLNIKNKDKGYTLEVFPNENFGSVLNRLQEDQVLSNNNKRYLYIFAKIKRYDRKIKKGEYLVIPGTTAIKLLQQLSEGKVILHKFTIVEGLRFEQIINSLQNHPKIQKTITNLNCNNILRVINRSVNNGDEPIKECEGLFLPNTYLFPKNTKDSDILQFAYDAMQNRLNNLWESRSEQGILKSSYEALILASIIEKETSVISEMRRISGVYHRRLKLSMPLQADPTVIYGLKIFDRPLSSLDLKKTSNYNTYRNRGLPPTPITTPSVPAIVAALNPVDDNSLYFVADGSGGHIFSASLLDHNKAISLIKKNNKANSQQ